MKRSDIEKARQGVAAMLRDAGLVLHRDETVEITDFGTHAYEKVGLGLVMRVNEPEYCSQWLTVLPGQVCPNHHHKIVKETFFIIRGDVRMWLGGATLDLRAGDRVTFPAGTWHRFTSNGGAVIEEISAPQVEDDSYFEDATIRRFVTVEDG
jgi:mannose-6-phosphate isomerase-like protein (cupin superfamily)